MTTLNKPGINAVPGPQPSQVLFVCRPDDLGRLVEQAGTPRETTLHAPDVFEASLLLARQPAITTLVISLAGLYPQELHLIEAVKRNRPAAQVIVADASRRGAALARATRLGADRLLAPEGLVPLRSISSAPSPDPEADGGAVQAEDPADPDPFLSTAELRALLGP